MQGCPAGETFAVPQLGVERVRPVIQDTIQVRGIRPAARMARGTGPHGFVQRRPAFCHEPSSVTNLPSHTSEECPPIALVLVDILRPSPVREQAGLRNPVVRKRAVASGIDDRFPQPTVIARPELWVGARVAPEAVHWREFLRLRHREAQREPEQRRRRDPLAYLPSRVFPFRHRRHC